jgi:hypothetical protein
MKTTTNFIHACNLRIYVRLWTSSESDSSFLFCGVSCLLSFNVIPRSSHGLRNELYIQLKCLTGPFNAPALCRQKIRHISAPALFAGEASCAAGAPFRMKTDSRDYTWRGKIPSTKTISLLRPQSLKEKLSWGVWKNRSLSLHAWKHAEETLS